MARWRKIDVRIWGDSKVRALSPIQPCGQGLWIYLLTSPESTSIPGLFRSGESGMAEALGWSLKGFREAFHELFRQGLAKACWDSRVVWIPKAVKYNPPDNPNVVKSWAPHFDEIPECALKSEAWQALKQYLEGRGEPFLKPFLEGCRNGMANQEQEQEQEQEQPPLPPVGEDLEVERVYTGWMERSKTSPESPTVAAEIRKRIRKRLAEKFTPEQLLACVDFAVRDEFYRGKRYAKQPDVIWRDATRVHDLLERIPENGNGARKVGTVGQRTMDTAQRLIAEWEIEDQQGRPE